SSRFLARALASFAAMDLSPFSSALAIFRTAAVTALSSPARERLVSITIQLTPTSANAASHSRARFIASFLRLKNGLHLSLRRSEVARVHHAIVARHVADNDLALDVAEVHQLVGFLYLGGQQVVFLPHELHE